MTEADNIAVTHGILVSLAAVIGFLIWLMTGDNTPMERRASRWGIAAGILCAGLVILAEWGLYAYVDRTAGLFMIMPSIVMALIAMWFGGKAVYRALGGGQEKPAPKIAVELDTLERQGEIWCQLRDLPHFRETLAGDLINLATGDLAYWAKIEGQKCIEIKLAGKTVITASRYETLTKYLAVQQGMSRLLFADRG